MIAKHCFQRDWIERSAGQLRCRNPNILEKAIVALQLVAHLVESGLPFQFKGGTCLLLLIQPIRRLSVDVDIVTEATAAELEALLKKVSRLPPFTTIEHDPVRDRELPPKKHYRAFYDSPFHRAPHDHVLLDVLFEPTPAHGTEPVLISTPFIEVEREVRVAVPGINGLLGDKLTAFAPRTIGILYHGERSADIVKQLFDVALLFDVATDLSAAATAYEAVHANQCRYRQNQFSFDQTLDDTIAACTSLGGFQIKGRWKSEASGALLAEGVKRLQGHLVHDPFVLDHARIAAGKAACAAAWIKRRPPPIALESLRYRPERIEELRAAAITAPWLPLHRLKGGNPEAFFYWWRAQQILNNPV